MGEFDARHRIGPAVWPNFDLLAIHSGRVEIQMHHHDRIELSAGQAVLIYPHTHFAGESLVKVSRVSVQHFSLVNVEAAGYPSTLRGLAGRRGGYEIFDRLGRGVYRDIERAMRLSRRAASPSLQVMREAILILILTQLLEGNMPPPGPSPMQEVGIDFAPLTRWMTARLDDAPSLEEMARFMGWSTSHFRALFARQMGCPPAQFLRRLRLIEATRLLRETGLPIKTIARKLGYDDLSHFYRFFATLTPVTPNAYRRRYRVRG